MRLPSALELRIAARYLRSRRGGRGVSLITGIAVGGLAVGVMALIVVLGLGHDVAQGVVKIAHPLAVLGRQRDRIAEAECKGFRRAGFARFTGFRAAGLRAAASGPAASGPAAPGTAAAAGAHEIGRVD